jgi:hypothetical protein
VINRPLSYVREVFSGDISDGSNHADYGLMYALDLTLLDRHLDLLCNLVDPSYSGGDLQGEPGWLIQRQMEIGEPQRRAQRLLLRFPHGGKVIKDPGPTVGPDATWPPSARFKVELYEPEEFGSPKYPVRYYDAATFESFLQTLLSVYVKYNPESKLEVEQILNHARYWAEHDRGAAKGV